MNRCESTLTEYEEHILKGEIPDYHVVLLIL